MNWKTVAGVCAVVWVSCVLLVYCVWDNRRQCKEAFNMGYRDCQAGVMANPYQDLTLIDQYNRGWHTFYWGLR